MGNGYEAAFDKLNDRQRIAVTQVDGPVLVIAGPGTGKTQLLTTRVAHILKHTDTLPQNILCLTFTDSAVDTMRDRLKGIIGKYSYDVSISTYHGFSNDLIRRNPDYFEKYIGSQSIDDLKIHTILSKVLGKLPYSNKLRNPDFYINDIKKLISDSKKALLTPEDIKTIANSNRDYLKAIDPLVSEHFKDFVKMDKKALPLFESLYVKLNNFQFEENVKFSQTIVSFRKLLLQTLKKALDDANIAGNQKPLTVWKNDHLEKDIHGKFAVKSLMTQNKLSDFADIYDLYNKELENSGLYDYDDMILAALSALKQNDDFRFTLQEQYLYILLDEFQDTNEAQFELVQMLSNNPVNEDRPNVMAVGDDDQAIYTFQGADYSHMLKFYDIYKDVKVVNLTDNYRSSPDILLTASNISGQVTDRLNKFVDGIDKTLLPKADISLKPELQRRKADSDLAQYGWVTRKIQELINGGLPASEIAVLAPQHKYLEPLTEFLARARIPMRYEKSENILDDRAIRQLYNMSRLVIALGTGTYDLADSLWPEVLSYDFWGLKTTQIWQISLQAYDKKQLWTDILLSDEQLKPITLFFIRLGILSGNESLEVMMDYLIGTAPLILNDDHSGEYKSPYYDYYFEQPAIEIGLSSGKSDHINSANIGTFWQLLNNLTVLRSKLREYKSDESPSLYLSDFISYVDEIDAAKIKVLNSSPHVEAENAVNLMTAFKAKGQEFSAVFLLACIDEAWGDKARGAGNKLSLPINLSYIRYGGATGDERLRLFYVALTRAKSQLYLMDYSSSFNGRHTTPLQFLDENSDQNGKTFSPLLPENSSEVLPAYDSSVPPQAAELAAYWRLRHHKEITKSTSQELIRQRLINYQLNPTDLNEFIDVEHAGPESFYMYKLLRFPSTQTPDIRYGNAMHNTLNWIHIYNRRNGSIPTLSKVKENFAIEMEKQRLSSDRTRHFLQRGYDALSVYLTQRKHTISIDNECEYSFRSQGVFIGDAHLNGKIDKLIIDSAKKTITIVDYKTGNTVHKWERSTKLHRYEQQLYLYKYLVEKSHSFAGYKVVDAYLEYVEPDEENEIVELHFKFDSNTAEHIEKLVQAVWQLIQNIQIPDTKDFKADLSGIMNFENYLISNFE